MTEDLHRRAATRCSLGFTNDHIDVNKVFAADGGNAGALMRRPSYTCAPKNSLIRSPPQG
jgi:hypothetical protein